MAMSIVFVLSVFTLLVCVVSLVILDYDITNHGAVLWLCDWMLGNNNKGRQELLVSNSLPRGQRQ